MESGVLAEPFKGLDRQLSKALRYKKRKGQYYLNTNHYTLGIKTVGLWRGKGFSKMAYLVSKMIPK